MVGDPPPPRNVRSMGGLALTAALAGLGGASGPHRPPSDRCPLCGKGKLVQSVTGAQYCHRCSFYRKAL